ASPLFKRFICRAVGIFSPLNVSARTPEKRDSFSPNEAWGFACLNQETNVAKLGASQFTPIAAFLASRKAKAIARVILVESKATVDPSRFTISFMKKESER